MRKVYVSAMHQNIPDPPDAATDLPAAEAVPPAAEPVREIGGPKERDPTRYGDWTVKGRCIDF